ncbi:hypothetical protein SNEBB_004846 [Seison nebaliae]|nr:hypothetical protein SNEBB_004846 [Seison nebaliae]
MSNSPYSNLPKFDDEEDDDDNTEEVICIDDDLKELKNVDEATTESVVKREKRKHKKKKKSHRKKAKIQSGSEEENNNEIDDIITTKEKEEIKNSDNGDDMIAYDDNEVDPELLNELDELNKSDAPILPPLHDDDDEGKEIDKIQSTIDEDDDDDEVEMSSKEKKSKRKSESSYSKSEFLELKPLRVGSNRRRKKDLYNSTTESNVTQLMDRMRKAADKDRYLLRVGKLQTEKLRLLSECISSLNNNEKLYTFIDNGGLGLFSDWLSLLPDTSLPITAIRDRLIAFIHQNIQTVDIELLQQSGLGRAIGMLSEHHSESEKNKKLCRAIIYRWMTPIVQEQTRRQSENFSDEDDYDDDNKEMDESSYKGNKSKHSKKSSSNRPSNISEQIRRQIIMSQVHKSSDSPSKNREDNNNNIGASTSKSSSKVPQGEIEKEINRARVPILSRKEYKRPPKIDDALLHIEKERNMDNSSEVLRKKISKTTRRISDKKRIRRNDFGVKIAGKNL